MMADEVLCEVKNGIAIVTLNRPESVNSLSRSLMIILRETLNRLERDDSTRVIILTGSGEKAFCAGIDVKERAKMSQEDVFQSRRFHVIPLFRDIEEMTKPLIASINGVALGGGAELALACDMRIATDNASFGLREIKWGIIPPCGACQRLPRIVGLGKAKELIFTGRVIDAKEAEGMGIYNRVVPWGQLNEVAHQLAKEISENSPVALRQAKKAINVGANLSMALAFDYEASKECYFMRDLEGSGLKGLKKSD